MRSRIFYLLAVIFLITVSCEKSSEESDLSIKIPKGFPAIDFPEGNEFTEERWKLGKRLFYDPILSVDSTISCASCHKQAFAFSDNVPKSAGAMDRAGTRNAPSLANLAYHPHFTREGAVPTLEMQVLVPIQEHNEFAFNIVEISEKLKKIDSYVSESQSAYGKEPDHFVITRAIANFERSLISGNSPYDKYRFQGDADALSTLEKTGETLFFSERTSCSSCHSGFNFTNYAFENNGLYEEYDDPGRFRFTGEESDKAVFKVPSLRNVAVSAPYMFDGSIKSLAEVISHYNAGGSSHINKNELIRPLGLSDDEQEALLAFLMTLTDDSFINDPKFRKE